MLAAHHLAILDLVLDMIVPASADARLPAASSVAATSATIAGPKGSQACSSSRIHCTRIGTPGKARAISTASAATSSAPLWP